MHAFFCAYRVAHQIIISQESASSSRCFSCLSEAYEVSVSNIAYYSVYSFSWQSYVSFCIFTILYTIASTFWKHVSFIWLRRHHAIIMLSVCPYVCVSLTVFALKRPCLFYYFSSLSDESLCPFKAVKRVILINILCE